MSTASTRRSSRPLLAVGCLLLGAAGCAPADVAVPTEAATPEGSAADVGVELDLPRFGEGVRPGASTTADEADGAAASEDTDHVVEAQDADGFAFAPASLTVTVGDSVRWEMAGEVAHTVTGSGLASGIVDPGGSFSVTFDTPGEVAYICYLHPGMTGTVTVTG